MSATTSASLNQPVTSQQIYQTAQAAYNTNIKPLMNTCGEIGTLKEAARLFAVLYSDPNVPAPTIEDLKRKRESLDIFSKKIATANELALKLTKQLDKAAFDMENRIVAPATLATIQDKQPDLHSATMKENEVCQKYLTEIRGWNAQLKAVANQITTRSNDASKHVTPLFTIIDAKIKTSETPNKSAGTESLTARLAFFLPWGTTSNPPIQTHAQDGKGTEFNASEGEIIVISSDIEDVTSESKTTSPSLEPHKGDEKGKKEKKEAPKPSNADKAEKTPEPVKNTATSELFD